MSRTLATLVVLGALEAFACECKKIEISESRANAVDVVEATVTALDDTQQQDWIGTLEVTRRWKGAAVGAKLTVRSRKGKACGVYLEQGKRYLFFVMRDEKGFRVDLCTHSALIEASDRVLKTLGPPAK